MQGEACFGIKGPPPEIDAREFVAWIFGMARWRGGHGEAKCHKDRFVLMVLVFAFSGTAAAPEKGRQKTGNSSIWVLPSVVFLLFTNAHFSVKLVWR